MLAGFLWGAWDAFAVNTTLKDPCSSGLLLFGGGLSFRAFSEGLVGGVRSCSAHVGRLSHMSRTCGEVGEASEGSREEGQKGVCVCVCIRHELYDLHELETRKAR